MIQEKDQKIHYTPTNHTQRLNLIILLDILLDSRAVHITIYIR